MDRVTRIDFDADGMAEVRIILRQNIELRKDGHGEGRRTSVYDIYITHSVRT